MLGELRREYERQFFSPTELADMRERGAVAAADQVFARRGA